MPLNARDERGFTMIAALAGMTLVATLALVAVAAVSGDISLTHGDLDRRQAYEAAKAGVNEYAFQLKTNNSYWTKCTEVPPPNVVNQQGAKPLLTRNVPGSTGAKYAIELLPATGKKKCEPGIESATSSMLEASGPLRGTFRVRSTGFSGKSKVAIVATFRPVTFLDYVYFTEYETSDPSSYAFPNPSPQLEGVNTQCEKVLQERDTQGNALSLEKAGRNSIPFYTKVDPKTGKITESKYCRVISFVTGDFLNGPVHTNDTFAICGSPRFGRPEKSDAIEVGALSPGWYSTSKIPAGTNCSGSPAFEGTFRMNAPALSPPPTNAELKNIVEPSFKFKGQVRICLNGASMTVGNNGTCTGLYNGAFPANGVIYVENDVCSDTYSPFTATYPATSGCGNAYVHGKYSGQLTIAAETDIVIDEDLTREGESAVLGLIANNFVRVYHGHTGQVINPTTYEPECNGGTESSLGNVTIEAAILAIKHSFIVDHYDCGGKLGTLTVKGAIAQKFRGTVGTGSGSTGYLKNYNYDDRLRFLTPPSFLKPEQSVDWTIGRETIE